jgi:two-component system sensor histidine kinase HydH
MVKEMLDFSRPLELRRSRENVSQVIAESLLIVENVAIERSVILQTSSPHEKVYVSCDCMRIKQVIINLLMNAIQASPVGETVKISSYVNKGNLFIDVSDRGCGIPADKREEILLPFVTTKNDGTGLGLPIASKIVEAHNGHLKIIDNSAGGVTFRAILPL